MSETVEANEVSGPIVCPAVNKKCVFLLTGVNTESSHCSRKATMSLDGKALCDQHAELAMTAACGRNVKIVRQYP